MANSNSNCIEDTKFLKPSPAVFSPTIMVLRNGKNKVIIISYLITVKVKDKFTYMSLSKETLKELKVRMKRQLVISPKEMNTCTDEYEKAAQCIKMYRKSTGLIFDYKMTLHKCEWDPNYPACPERYIAVMNRIEELHLIKRCQLLSYEKATLEQITLKHDKKMFDILKSTAENFNVDDLEKEASKYDSVYFNNNTFEAALISAGCVISLVDNVSKGIVQNGMAIVRPPGHHAMQSEYCGYCFFNNVAIAAQHALNNNLAQKILIVDYDVHHGQGTQRMFYEDNRVLYFSIHRYEHGKFWPHLRESNFDNIGNGIGTGYNINVPLNETGLGDDEYMAIILNILLPVAYEYQPDLIIVSAGYDACVGCFEGMMNVTPGFYGHLITLLSGLAHGKIAVCLEGGYFLPSLAEGVAMTLKSLLDDPPPLLEPLRKPRECVIDVINNVKFVLRPFWKCFQDLDSHAVNEPDVHKVEVFYLGEPLQPPHPTRNCYPSHDQESIMKHANHIRQLQQEYEKIKCTNDVVYSYDGDMLLHAPEDESHPEKPERLKAVYEKFLALGLNHRCRRVPVEDIDINIIRKVHSDEYLRSLFDFGLNDEDKRSDDIYTNEQTHLSALKSTSCLLSVVECVLKGEGRAGAALIRPPGHHAEKDKASGFCFLNNIAIVTSYVVSKYKLKRVLILDFDIHHGNGTQHAFYDNGNVLYVSIHRYDCGKYYPKSNDADYCNVGIKEGQGLNVNIPFNNNSMTNLEYLAVFHRIILPIAYSFAPEIILVSAGFDAGINDRLGKYKVTPEAFGHFIQMLKVLAGGKIVLALEGGYNIETLAHSMNICVKTLLGDPLPVLKESSRPILDSAKKSIEAVINIHKQYWPILDVDKKLPAGLKPLDVTTQQDISINKDSSNK